MCKVYTVFQACGCKHAYLVIERCLPYIHANYTEVCSPMPEVKDTETAIVLSDSCTNIPEHATCSNMTEAERRVRVPTDKVHGRYLSAAEFAALPTIEVFDTEDESIVDTAAVLGLDAFQSLAGSLEGALPEVEMSGAQDAGVFKSFKSLSSALPTGH